MSEQSRPTPSSYFSDAENAAEMGRIARQARMLSEYTGLLPELEVLQRPQTVLDIGSGPGEWVLAVARQFPHCQVTGIDISQIMTGYAQAWAQAEGLTNTRFHIMDARNPLPFPDASFDLIHARLMISFLTVRTWPQVVAECYRLLKPGGIFCSVESQSWGEATTPSLMHYSILIAQALRRAGRCFTPEGGTYGITAVQHRLLQQAGFEHIKQQAHMVNGSAGMPAHIEMCNDWRTGLKLLQPFLVQQGVATQEELDVLYEEVLAEMQQDDFCGIWFLQSTWGEKPHQ